MFDLDIFQGSDNQKAKQLAVNILTKFFEKGRWHNIKRVYLKKVKFSVEVNSDLLTAQKYLIILSWQPLKPQQNLLLDCIIEFFSCFVR